MILSFRHKGLEALYRDDISKGVQAKHAPKLRRILGALDVVQKPEDLMLPSFHLHLPRGDLRGYWSIRVSGNWRVIFRFAGTDAELVDYLDDHREATPW